MVNALHAEREVPTKNVLNYLVGEESVPRFQREGLSGEPLCEWDQVPGLGEVIVDNELGRETAEGVTVFYNHGMGIHFATAGAKLYEIAEELDLGHEFPTNLLTQDYHL